MYSSYFRVPIAWEIGLPTLGSCSLQFIHGEIGRAMRGGLRYVCLSLLLTVEREMVIAGGSGKAETASARPGVSDRVGPQVQAR